MDRKSNDKIVLAFLSKTTLAFQDFRLNRTKDNGYLSETFSGPGTMDLEHDRLGFLGIFSKSADFSKL